ncbi:MAG TPA: hypothetical protein VK636_06715 [Gemmatimonadaceae bacterium]|nr:hypothetical protein [Gemmatimonadaceae bacterium]
MRSIAWFVLGIAWPLGTIESQSSRAPEKLLDATSTAGLELVHARAETVTYRGRQALHVLDNHENGKDGLPPAALAIVSASEFTEGTIQIDVAGRPRPGASDGARGFIGLAFHVRPGGSPYEAFYLRPTNGRADDQLRRNHSAQYIVEPDFPRERLRSEHPGEYESYVDLEAGAWTRMRIVVHAGKAQLYVNGAAQPCLIVDLKLTGGGGRIGLWLGPETDGYFSSLTVIREPAGK